MKKLIIITLFFICVVFSVNYIHTFTHEITHLQINNKYDVKTINFDVGFIDGGVTRITPINMSENKYLSYIEMQSITEIVGYMSNLILMVIIFCTYLIIILRG